MASSVMLPSFAGGELSTSLYARVDLDKYHSGCSLLRNMFVDYRGGVTNRPGLKFIYAFAAGKTVRTLPFIVSRDQSYIVAFEADGSGTTLQLFLNDDYIGSIAGPWLDSEIFSIRFVQSADVMTLVHPSHVPYNLSRTALTTFTLEAVTFGSSIAPPATNPTCTPTVAGTALSYCYCVTALDKDGGESLASTPSEVGSAVLDPTATTPVTIGLEWPTVTDAVGYNVYKAGPVSAGEAMPSVYGYIGNTKIAAFTDNNIGPDFSRTPPEHRDPFSPGQITAITVTAPGSGMVNDYEPVVITGDGTGARAFVAAKGATNLAAGVIIVDGGINYTAATAAPTSGSATFSVSLDLNNRYPACVTYFEQRRVYGGSDYAPTLIEMSRPGQYSNFDVSPSVADSDSITVNIASREVNAIQHMVPMSTGLVVFTKGNAFLLTGGGGSGAVTPANVSATSQASTGAGDLQPLIINYNILFNQYEGTVVRDMAFQWQTSSYYGSDRSMLSNHLFSGYDLVDWNFAMEPFRLVWAVRSDGTLLSLTYVPEQDIYGWAQHVTEGNFRSVAVIPNGREDVPYFVVSRTVDGAAVTYLERMFSRLEVCSAEARFLDSAVELPIEVGTIPLAYTVSGLTITATIPASMVSGGVGTPGAVGSYCLDLGCAGHASITAIVANGDGTATITATLAAALAPLPGTTSVYPIIPAGDWGIGTYQTSLTVPHLTGSVELIVDGIPQGAQTVTTPTYPGFYGLSYEGITTSFATPYTSVDWTRNKLFIFGYTNVGLTNYAVSSVSLTTYLQLATAAIPNNATLINGNQFTQGQGFVDSQGYPYTCGMTLDSAHATLFKYDPTTLATVASFGVNGGGGVVTDANHLSLPAKDGQVVVLADGANYLLQCSAAANEIAVINLDTMAWTGTNLTITEGGNASACHGITGTGVGYVAKQDGAGAYVALYRIALTAAGVPSKTLVATIPKASVAPAWAATTIQDVASLFCDESDGNICLWLHAASSAVALIKVNVSLGTVMWTNLTAGVYAPLSFHPNLNSVSRGKLMLLTPLDDLVTVDLATGVQTLVYNCTNFQNIGNVVQFWNDQTNTFIVAAAYTTGSPSVPVRLSGPDGDAGRFVVLSAVGGTVSWASPSCNAYAGLSYCSQFATLRLDTGEPTIQGRRKFIPAVTCRVLDSVGFEVGTNNFTDMLQPKADLGGSPTAPTGYTPWTTAADGTPDLFTGDVRINVYAGWERAGMITVKQCNPFPLTILGLIPEVTLGDTQR